MSDLDLGPADQLDLQEALEEEFGIGIDSEEWKVTLQDATLAELAEYIESFPG